MQSTGVYWIVVYDILEAAGLEVYLVNAQQTKNLPGRKSDVQESQLANVLSDISGATGQAIIKAILAGERNPHKLAALRDYRVKANEQQIAQYLEGNWQEDLLFVLKQEQEAYQFCQQQMAACDRQLEQYFQGREDRSRCASLPEERRKARLKKKQGK